MLVALLLSVMPAVAADKDSFFQNSIADFKNSNIEFQRGQSQVPFFAIAALGGKYYADFELEGASSNDIAERGGSALITYDIDSFFQYAGLPILLDDNNVLIIGEYVARTDFNTDTQGYDSFYVQSLGLPVGWLQQASDNWQLGGFVMPLGHYSSQENSDWSWQVMGGAFSRYVQTDNLWWAFGLYVDITPDDNTYLPYIGASWAMNNHWTLSAIMPWPAILYAPNDDWLFRLGAAPSGASWRIHATADTGPIAAGNADELNVGINFDAWDFGASIERRMFDNIWLGFNAGIGGLRGLRFSGGDWKGTEFDVSSSPYIGLNLNYRPSVEDD